MDSNTKQSHSYSIGYLLLVALIGAVIGAVACVLIYRQRWLAPHESKLQEVLELTRQNYVDELSLDSIEEKAIPQILSLLDPHSTYLTREENLMESERLGGSFMGIGIQFSRIIDTIVVNRVIAGGPSQRAGLEVGDRILRADTVDLRSSALTDQEIISRLRGEEGSIVRLTIYRDGKEMSANVVRGPVPVSSLDAAYMITDQTLYVRLNGWGATTIREFYDAYALYNSTGAVQSILLDLRDNGGGYMDAAIGLAGIFLPKDHLILYAEGKAFEREDFTTQFDGILKDIPLVVMVNELSASASEIFAGVMQDYDRATIVGRRTFGKGLVQQSFTFADSSALRLTVARYYIPSGRSVQRSYAQGSEAYAHDIEERFADGEVYSDSIMPPSDSTRYYTAGGRLVYAGGGISPDVVMPRDSAGINSYYTRILMSGEIPKFSFKYADSHRAQLSSFETPEALATHLQSLGTGFLFEFAYYAQDKGIPIRTSLLRQSEHLLLSRIRAQVASFVSSEENAFWIVYNQTDQEIKRALSILESDQWKPQVTK